jgi:hypothetical protein
MRLSKTLCMVLLLTGMAAAQATVIGGTASSWAPAYGVYAAPFVPLVVTPSATLATVSPSAVGASNATFGNVAGATNATLSIVPSAPVGVYTQPVWYGPSSATIQWNRSRCRVLARQSKREVCYGQFHCPKKSGAIVHQSGCGPDERDKWHSQVPGKDRTHLKIEFRVLGLLGRRSKRICEAASPPAQEELLALR